MMFTDKLLRPSKVSIGREVIETRPRRIAHQSLELVGEALNRSAAGSPG